MKFYVAIVAFGAFMTVQCFSLQSQVSNGSDFYCFTCFNSNSNSDCNHNDALECPPDKQARETEVRHDIELNLTIVTKQCMDPDQCRYPNIPYCGGDGTCRYCCLASWCNGVKEPPSLDCPVGRPGPPGRDGRDGATGSKGIEGRQGPKGDQGLTGNPGPIGPNGLIGIPGLKGDQGNSGPIGPQGMVGNSGLKGDQGMQGPTGAPGQKGDPGITDCSGPNQRLNPANHHCYEIIPRRMNFDEAVNACKNLSVPNAHLVTLEDGKLEEEFVARFMLQNNANMTRMWVGARRPPRGSRDNFLWVHTGQSINYSNWRPGQPYEGHPDADCVTMTSENLWKWDDNECSSYASIGCEYDIVCF